MNASLRTPGYLAGRHLAIADRLQRAALGAEAWSLADKYLGLLQDAPRATGAIVAGHCEANLAALRARGELRLANDFERSLADSGCDLPERFELFDKNVLYLGYQHQSHAFRDGARALSGKEQS